MNRDSVTHHAPRAPSVSAPVGGRALQFEQGMSHFIVRAISVTFFILCGVALYGPA